MKFTVRHFDMVQSVWLDGRDVTHSCYEADTKRGLVKLYKRDENDEILRTADGEDLRRETLQGEVRVVLKRFWPWLWLRRGFQAWLGPQY